MAVVGSWEQGPGGRTVSDSGTPATVRMVYAGAECFCDDTRSPRSVSYAAGPGPKVGPPRLRSCADTGAQTGEHQTSRRSVRGWVRAPQIGVPSACAWATGCEWSEATSCDWRSRRCRYMCQSTCQGLAPAKLSPRRAGCCCQSQSEAWSSCWRCTARHSWSASRISGQVTLASIGPWSDDGGSSTKQTPALG